MAVRTLIVDDEPLARASIASLLRDDPDVMIVGECGSGTEAIQAIRHLRPALLFLDVQMPGCDGFDVLEALGSEAPPAVVFVTAYDRYAVRAFEAEALDYLLKPFDDTRFLRVLARAKAAIPRRPVEQTLERRGLDRIIVKSAGRVVFLRASEIDWIEAADYYACLHVGSRTHLLRRSMSDLDRDLDRRTFCRVHRSAIVNIARVREMRLHVSGEYEVVLQDGTTLRVSRSYRDTLQEQISAGNQSSNIGSPGRTVPGSITEA